MSKINKKNNPLDSNDQNNSSEQGDTPEPVEQDDTPEPVEQGDTAELNEQGDTPELNEQGEEEDNKNQDEKLICWLEEIITSIKSKKINKSQMESIREFYLESKYKEKTEEEKDIKYYILGWYIYNNILF